ncbi:MAG: TolC family protein [Thermodesulfobacteriota bacterium]|nr:MAG: TolC family protein [Thermodesulfobacteriota bacterium]
MKIQRKTHAGIILCIFWLYLSLSSSFAEEIKKDRAVPVNTMITSEGLNQNSKDDTIPLPLKHALEIALQNNLNLQIEKINIPVSAQEIIVNKARFDPSLFGEAYNRRYEYQTSYALTGAPLFKENEQAGKVGIRKLFSTGLEAESYYKASRYRDNSDYEGLDPQYKNLLILSLRQPLLQDFGPSVNTTNIKVAENNFKIKESSFLLQVVNTINQVERTYHDLSGALETLDLRNESLRLAEKLFADNQKRFNAGLTHVGEVQEAETAIASRQELVIAASQTVKDVTNILKNILQIQPGSPLYPVSFQTEGLLFTEERIPSYEESFSQALNNRPDYSQKKIALESKDIIVKFSKNQLLPRLDLIGTFGLNGLSGEAHPLTFEGVTAVNPYGGNFGDSWEGFRHADGYEWNVGLTIDFPLGKRADSARYQQAKLFKEQAILDLKNLEDTIDLEIKVALENIKDSQDRINVAERFVDLADKTLRQEEERMKAGLSDTFRILIFQVDLINAKIRKVQALVDYQKALAQLYRSTGTNTKRYDMVVNYPDASRPVP